MSEPSPQDMLDFLGGELPPEPSPYGNSYNYWEPRYQNLGPIRRGRASLGNMLSSMPLIRNTGLADFVSNSGDMEISRNARPFLSKIEGHVGNSIPFAMLGTGPYVRSAGEIIDVPPILFGSIPRSAVSTGGLSALDAYGANENVRDAFVSGAASGAIPALATKALTPRTLDGAANVGARAIRDADTLRSGAIPQGLSSRTNPFAYERRGALGNDFNVGPIDRYAYEYGTNQLISPETRALINAVLGSQFQEANMLPDRFRALLDAVDKPNEAQQ